MQSDQNKEAKNVAHEHSLSSCDYCGDSTSFDPINLLDTLRSYSHIEPATKPFLIKDGVKIIL